METIALVTGGFDPIHEGHIRLLRAAELLGEIVVVGLNSDEWLVRKKGAAFMDWRGRATILRNMWMVSAVIPFDDRDDTACDAIEVALGAWPESKIVFCNGGDRGESNTPEFEKYNRNPRVNFAFNVGGGKMQSSSDLLAKWEARHASE
jgi:cytidyltransferase-like protein